MATRRRRRDDNATSRPRRWRDAPLDEPPGALCPGRSCVIALTSRVTTTCLQARSVRLTTPLTPDLAGSEPMGPSEPGLVWSRSAPRSVSRRSARARSPSRQGVPSRGGRHNRASARAAGGSDQQARQPLPSNGRATDSTSRQPRQQPPSYDRATDSTTIRLANRSAPAAAPRTGTDHQAHTGRPPSDDRATDSTVDAVHQPLPTYGRPPDRHPPASPPRAPPTYDRATCSTVQQAHQPLPTCGRPPDSHRPAGPHRPTPRTAAPQTAPTRWLMPANAPHSGALKPTEQHGLLPCVRRSPTGSASGPRQGAPPGACAWSHREPQA